MNETGRKIKVMVCYYSIIKGNIYVKSKGYIEWYTRLEKWYEIKMYSRHGMVRDEWLWYAV